MKAHTEKISRNRPGTIAPSAGASRSSTGDLLEQQKIVRTAEIPIIGFDFIEFYVGNAKQACYFYEHGLGFELVGYRGLETGDRTLTSYALRQNNIKIILTSSMSSDDQVSTHVQNHGDGIRSIGFSVNDCTSCYGSAVERGAKSVSSPETHTDEFGTFISASVRTYGDTVHTFVQRNDYPSHIAPGFKPLNSWTGGAGLINVDHIVGNVECGRLMDWVNFYESVFGFHVFQGFNASDISTQYSALTSRVMANEAGTIKMPLNEPAEGAKRSQIQEYLDFYGTPGVQHIALTTNNIIATVSELRRRGIEFLSVPPAYYSYLKDRVGAIDEDLNDLAKLGILVDRESNGYLLQIFTKPIEDRPTLFLEIIQRKGGACGFGKGNFLSLFESLEREQDLRGNL